MYISFKLFGKIIWKKIVLTFDKGVIAIGILDIIGPVMVGPSSSHTAGAVHLGLFARALLEYSPKCAQIGLHGSFSHTGEGHGTHLAILAGVLGFATDDERIPHANVIAAQVGLAYSFTSVDLGDVHPNSAQIRLSSSQDEVQISGSSIGGGKIRIWRVNRYRVELDGSYPTLLSAHHDHPGVIANISGLLAKYNLNIAAMKVYRTNRGGPALSSIELDHSPGPDLLAELKSLPNILDVRFIAKILPD